MPLKIRSITVDCADTHSLADPEGNELCIERGDLERTATSQTYRLGS